MDILVLFAVLGAVIASWRICAELRRIREATEATYIILTHMLERQIQRG